MGIQKYRVGWKFTGTKNSNGQFASSTSPSFWRSNRSKGYIDLTFKTLPSGNSAFCFYLRFSNSLNHTRIDQSSCSYYIINEATGQHHKLVNISPFMTDWFDFGVGNRMEFLVILALDVNEPSRANSIHWWETKTEALNHANISLSSSPTLINGKECRLKCIVETREGKEILIDGLKPDEFVNTNFQIRNNEPGVSDRHLQVALRSSATSLRINAKEQINKIALLSFSKNLTEMKKARISKISQIIENIDLLLSKEISQVSQKVLEMKAAIQQQVLSSIRGSSTSYPKKSINDNSALTPPAPAAVTVLPEQTKHIMYPNKRSIHDNSTTTQPAPAAVIALPEQTKHSMYTFFTEKKFTDITIQVRNGHEIKAHKCVLFCGSTVWRQRLTEDDQLSIITVTDFEMETIETLVTFIYIGAVPKLPEQTDQLLIAAETYGVNGLKTWCEQQLMAAINIDSAINLLVLAHRNDAKTLYDEILTFARKNIAELSQRHEFESFFLAYPELGFELIKNIFISKN